MSDFDLRPIFEVEGRAWTWGDAFAGAALRGELAAAEAQTRAGLARQAQGDPPEGAWNAEARAFRVENGLGAARDMLRWLDAVGLDANAWMDALARRMLAQAPPPEGAPEPAPAVDPEALALALRADLAIAGQLPSLAHGLAERVALVAARGDLPAADAEDRLAAVEAAFTRARAEIGSRAAVHAHLRAHLTDWISVHLTQAAFPGEDAAFEAMLCVRQDGLDLVEVAHEARVPVYGRRARLRDLDADLRARLLGVRPGELVGPLDRPDGPTVLVVREKVLPTADDPVTLEAVGEVLVRAAAAVAVEQRVRWLVRA